jgi:hypothetical protein
MSHVIKFIVNVERLSIDWGFKLSVAKSCMFFSKNKVADNIQLFLYGQQPVGRVSKYKYLGLWFNERYTWKDVRRR